MTVGVAAPDAGEEAATEEQLAFEVLGPVRVLAHGHPIDVGGAGPLSLLAWLVLHPNTVVPVDELVEAIWGEQDPRSPRRMVGMSAGRIRRALQLTDEGEPALVAEAPGFRLAINPET